jgi:hypothetical protein
MPIIHLRRCSKSKAHNNIRFLKMEEIVKVIHRALRQHLESNKGKLEVNLVEFALQEAKKLSDEEYLQFTKYRNSGDHPFIAYLMVRFNTDSDLAHWYYSQALIEAGINVVDLQFSSRKIEGSVVVKKLKKDGYFSGDFGVIRRHNVIATVVFFILKTIIAISLYSDSDQFENSPLSITSALVRYFITEYVIKKAIQKNEGEQYREFFNVFILNGAIWVIQVLIGLFI